MCMGSPKVSVAPPPPAPVPPPPPPAPVTVTAPPIFAQASPMKKRQVRASTQARQRRTALGGVTGKRKFLIPLSGGLGSAARAVAGSIASGVNA
jgi:hypothetical protein